MENILTALKVKCVQAGTNLSQVCRKAGIHRQTIDRWERELPKSFQIMAQLEKALEDIKAEKSA